MLRSLTTLLLILRSFAIPLDDDDDDDPCGSEQVLAPLHTVSHESQTPVILVTAAGIVIALVVLPFLARYIVRRRRRDPFRDPKKRLSDESWVSPVLPPFSSPGSPLLHDLELSRYACPQRKLVPVTTPVCTPTDAEFGSRLECGPDQVIHVPPVRVPSPVYISPSPSRSSSSSSLSHTPSTEPLSPVRFSRLLSSTFRDTRITTSPMGHTTAHRTRSYANAYRPLSATTTPTTSSTRFSGTRSRTSFYPGPTQDAHATRARVRDTFSTMTTSDTDTVCTVPHLLRAVAEFQPSASPFADPSPGNEQSTTKTETPLGTPLGLKLRLSDASEHARYRLREREREHERQLDKERAAQRFSTESQTSEASTDVQSEEVEVKKEFKLRDSESVLREIGW